MVHDEPYELIDLVSPPKPTRKSYDPSPLVHSSTVLSQAPMQLSDATESELVDLRVEENQDSQDLIPYADETTSELPEQLVTQSDFANSVDNEIDWILSSKEEAAALDLEMPHRDIDHYKFLDNFVLTPQNHPIETEERVIGDRHPFEDGALARLADHLASNMSPNQSTGASASQRRPKQKASSSLSRGASQALRPTPLDLHPHRIEPATDLAGPYPYDHELARLNSEYRNSFRNRFRPLLRLQNSGPSDAANCSFRQWWRSQPRRKRLSEKDCT
ncbi:MAG: hypothetical protein M1821_007197 [Bathelium mastoideum]|nr:MAG: hypothetical protein M1821_007197 [Bathelium mastoideum]